MARIIENPKDLILNTAKHLAEQDGLSQLNMRTLARECDISLGTIYNYYPTKTDVIMAVIEGFWNECFRSFYKTYDDSLDFFDQLRCFYFAILDYLEHFKSNWLKDLLSLSHAARAHGKQKESEYMSHFQHSFKKLLENHKHEFDPLFFEALDLDLFILFITGNFMTMLRRQDHNYDFFDLILRRLLIGNL